MPNNPSKRFTHSLPKGRGMLTKLSMLFLLGSLTSGGGEANAAENASAAESASATDSNSTKSVSGTTNLTTTTATSNPETSGTSGSRNSGTSGTSGTSGSRNSGTSGTREKVGNSRSSRKGSTGTSGKTSNSKKKDVNIDPNKGRHIYGLKWSERGDKPCYIDVFTGGFAKGKFDPVTGRDGEAQSECEKKSSSMKPISFGAPTSSSFYAVNGLQLCLNSKETRMKGIKLYALKVNEGVVSGSSSSKTVKRTNCSKWQTTKKCPTGQIASELTFYYEDGAIKGINLDCSDYYWE